MLTSSDPTPHGLRAWKNGEPWLSFTAINWLESRITPETTVLEWGCGGSTVWYSKRAGAVDSIEHDPVWLEKVNERIAHEGLATSTRHYVQKNPEGCFTAYSEFARTLGRLYDIVVVDGRGRVRCIKEGKDLVEHHGILVLDNADRSYYSSGIAMLAGWERIEFPDRWLTTVFLRPEVG